jgi:hypothetical protein
MPIPNFTSAGDFLPVSIAPAAEVLGRFGGGSASRQEATASLVRIHQVAAATGKRNRLIIFGSYVTAKPDPQDVDVVLVMADDFRWHEQAGETRDLFDHQRATQEFGASVFWVRPSAILVGTLDEFIAHWQVTRDRSLRGIVEVKG